MRIKKSLYTDNQLEDYCQEETTIECSSCKKIDGEPCEAYYAVQDFFKRGWRATENNCYCPKCAKKKLKLK